ncbi:hypothetical protein DXG01_006686 [Tephrocybe rancida]|nr:hypothetical protein DXG01_006686 [Tephrocybe rancida]
MQHRVLSAIPLPSGGVQPNQGWYQQMVDYVAEMNAQNRDEQGRLDGLIKGLGKHAHGDGIRKDLNRRIANLEQSTREGFARIGERLKAIWDRADATTCDDMLHQPHGTKADGTQGCPLGTPNGAITSPHHICFIRLKPAPQSDASLAQVSMTKDDGTDTKDDAHTTTERPLTDIGKQPQDDGDETRAPDTEVKVSDAEDEVPGAPQFATPGSAPAAQVVTIVTEPENISKGIWVEQLKAEANTDSGVMAKSISTEGKSREAVAKASIADVTAAGKDAAGPPPSIAVTSATPQASQEASLGVAGPSQRSCAIIANIFCIYVWR